MGRRVELQIPPQSDHLALVRLVVETTARVGGQLPERRIDDLRLAVTEACANALEAMQAAGSAAPVTITIDLQADAIEVSIADRAGGFEVEALDPIPAATDPRRLRHERGLGIPLMRSLADEVVFAATPEGTTVHLVVHS